MFPGGIGPSRRADHGRYRWCFRHASGRTVVPCPCRPSRCWPSVPHQPRGIVSLTPLMAGTRTPPPVRPATYSVPADSCRPCDAPASGKQWPRHKSSPESRPHSRLPIAARSCLRPGTTSKAALRVLLILLVRAVPMAGASERWPPTSS
jgi:hypothetical protein